MNIHIVPDEKFIDTFIEITGKVTAPGSNVFLVRDKKPFKYLKSTNIVEAPIGTAEFHSYIDKLGKGDFVYMHTPSHEVWEWLAATDCQAAFIWIFWGGEFYEATRIEFDLYLPLTLAHVDKDRWAPRLSRWSVLHDYRFWLKKQAYAKVLASHQKPIREAVAKLSYFMHYTKFDFLIVKKHLPNNAKFIRYSVPPPYNFTEMDDMLPNIKQQLNLAPTDLNIWLGNSGYPANNHLDYISIFSKMNIPNLKVWAPLSYGDQDYIQHVITVGHTLLPGQFGITADYMSFDSFMKAIHAMDVGIMPHKRPQAFGNIQLLLYFGKKVFMDEDSSLYDFLIDASYHIYPLSKMTKEQLETPLMPAEKEHNRTLMIAQFSKDVSQQHLAHCLHL